MNQTTTKSGATFTETLKHGESVIVYGLSSEDRFAVTEADYHGDGYKTSYKIVMAPIRQKVALLPRKLSVLTTPR